MWRGRFNTPFVTPEDNPPGTISRRILIPGNEQFAQLVTGVLAELLQPENFTETPGGLSVEETVQRFHSMFTSYLEPVGGTMQLPIGTIIPHMIAGPLPAHLLPCDGGQYEPASYPELYALLPETMKTAEYFLTPDLRTRVPVGAAENGQAFNTGLGGMAGQAEVALTVQQLPPHSHTTVAHFHQNNPITVGGQTMNIPTTDNRASWSGGAANIPRHTNTNANGSQAVTIPSQLVTVGQTSSESVQVNNTGSGWVHTNLQPFTVVNYAIIALEI